MDIFRILGSGSLSVTAMLDFSGKANTSIHGLAEDVTASTISLLLSHLTIRALRTVVVVFNQFYQPFISRSNISYCVFKNQDLQMFRLKLDKYE